ncbi:MAG TPA: hypothetical protein VEI97_00775 [bacterium]|nr:hypothetical protein [bacterium]
MSVSALALSVLVGTAGAAWAIDDANLEQGYPTPLEDAMILRGGEQTFTVALRPTQRMDLNIEVAEGIGDRWQVSYSGRLENVKGNSDGNVGVEAIWLAQRDTEGRPGEALKLQLDFGQGNEEPVVNFLGIAQGRVGDLGVYANGGFRYQQQEGDFFNEFQWRAVAGGTLPLTAILGTPSTGIGALTWERTPVPGLDNPVRLDLGIRLQPRKKWLVFASAGTDLSPDNWRHVAFRAMGGITWDVTAKR